MLKMPGVGVSRVLVAVTRGNVVCMAQPHKGERVLVAARPPQAVYDVVRQRATQRGISISQYVADLLAIHVGRPDLVRELGRVEEVLTLAM